MRGRDLEGSIKINTLNALLTGAQQLVRAVLNPVGDIGVGRSSVRWIVFETAIGWRVVRRGDDDAICKSLRPTPVVPKNGVRNYRRWREAVISLNICLDTVCGQTSNATRSAGRERA